MRFGVSSWVWVSPLTTQKLAKLAPHVAGLGFDWVEVPIENTDDIDYNYAAEILKDNGLGVSVTAVLGSPDRDITHSDPANSESARAYMRHCIDAVKTMGGARVVGPVYSAVGRFWQCHGNERKAYMRYVRDQVLPVADYAAEKGVILCIEPLNRYETSFINTAAQGIELVDTVGHPAYQMMLDTYHMGTEEKSIPEAVRAVGGRLEHVHIGENDRGTPGKGQLAWKDFATALEEVGYNGALVIETFSSQVESIASAAAIWRELAPSQDDLARDGLAFLQRLLT
ncbi:MAG: sugar phosphate isomerase/epimerase [Armatimonadetes bacterium]|nr:sugar phosphate isomerase/epimerase [Armatimonadota bacterium]